MEKKEQDIAGIWPVWVAIPVFVGLFFCVMNFFGAVARGLVVWMQGAGWPVGEVMPLIVSESSMLLALLLTVGVMFRIEHRPWSDLGMSLKGHGKGWLYGFVVAVLLYGIGFGLSLALGEVEIVGVHWNGMNLLGAFILFFLVAVFEEMLVRGYLLGRLLLGGVNRFVALFLSACFFGAVHLFNPNVSVWPMVNLILAGMMLGASVLYTRNLCFPISLHLFWNWIQGPVLGYQVSGTDFLSTLLQLRLPENTLLNGGDFGFEGSLLCTVLMLLCTGWILYRGERGRLV